MIWFCKSKYKMIIVAFWCVYGVVMTYIRKNEKLRQYIPLFSAFFLLLFGLLAVFNVSVGESFDLTKDRETPTNFFYFSGQLKNIIIGIVAFLFVLLIPARLWWQKKFVVTIIVLALMMQALVLLPWWEILSDGTPENKWFAWRIIHSMELNGARWWVRILWVQNLQPAEFFKIGYVFFLAYWLIRKKKDINSSYFFLRFVIINMLLFMIFLYIKDLGTVMVLWLTGLCLCRYAWASFKRIGGILWWSVVTIWLGIAVLGMLLENNTFVQWQRWNYEPSEAQIQAYEEWRRWPPRYLYLYSRLTYFLSPSESQQETVWWQQSQAIAAVWWGRFWWRGIGQWLQKFRQIPEAYSDFIFAAFAEEIWFVGNMLLLTMYAVFFGYCLWRLPRIHDEFLQYLVAWLVSLLMIQTFVNIWVNIQILPNTGITLPFVSYGGSSIIAVLMMCAMLYKIVR